MQPNTRFTVDRRSVIKGAGLTLATAGGSAGVAAARGPPSMEPAVEIMSDSVMVTRAGAAIVTKATLPQGGFIAVFEGDLEGTHPDMYGGEIGATEPALGPGTYPYMMVQLDPSELPEEGDVSLTAAIFMDTNGDRVFQQADDEAYGPRDAETLTM